MADSTTSAPETAPLSAVPSTVASNAATPQSLPPMDAEEREKSIKVSLADLTAKASALYAQQNYEAASEVYATAAEQQAELNGDMDPENADILFLYGRCLFKVGQSKSNVLGGNAAGEEKKKQPKPKRTEAGPSTGTKSEGQKAAEESAVKVAEKAEKSATEEAANKPLFQFTGDENWDDSDDEEDGGDEGEEEEEEDDLAIAFQILDLTRVLFEKKLQQDEPSAEGEAKGKAEEDPTAKHVIERLGDTHDLLAEISLENEKYPEAIRDTRAALSYKQKLFPQEHEVIAEAHFKLSLALEFASTTTTAEDGGDPSAPKEVDQALRDEAASELEKTIESTRMKLKNKEVELAMIHAPEDNEETRKQIADVKEVISDLEQRLVELKKPPMELESVLAADNPMSGLLGAALQGESKEATQARVDEAKKNANDVSGLIRKKAKATTTDQQQQQQQPETAAADDGSGSGSGSKRKAEEELQPPVVDEETGNASPKKTKVEE